MFTGDKAMNNKILQILELVDTYQDRHHITVCFTSSNQEHNTMLRIQIFSSKEGKSYFKVVKMLNFPNKDAFLDECISALSNLFDEEFEVEELVAAKKLITVKELLCTSDQGII